MVKSGFPAIAVGLALASWAFASSLAHAGDKPEIGPPAVWVRASPTTPEPMKASAGAAIANLVEDQQEHFDGEGESFYVGYQSKVQSAEGLQTLGTVNFQWSPLTDRLVVHRVQVLRGAQVIDALPKDGVFTIARREDKLDSEGSLDGVLTVILPIEGLQVGDIVSVAFTLHHTDPLLKGRVDQVTTIPSEAPIAFERILLTWPQATPVRWRPSAGMTEPHVTNDGGFTEAAVVAEGVMPVVKPKGAPVRFQRDRQLAVTSYQSWSEVSSSMAPLYVAARQLKPDSPLKAEIASIASRTTDPEQRAGAALALVEDRIRYLAQLLGEGGLKPVSADDTWTHRYGDCKAKTALLLALLDGLGVKAEPILVSTGLGEDLDTRLPGLSFFDHVMVHATIDGRDYWLDGTRAGDRSLAALDTPGYGFVLPVRTEGADLVRLVRAPLKRPQFTTFLHFDASKGVSQPAVAHAESVFHGDLASGLRQTLGAMSPDDRDRTLRGYWRKALDTLTVSTTSAAFDDKTGEAKLVADGEIKLDWGAGGYEPEGAVIGVKPDIQREPGTVNPDAPFGVQFPFYVEQETTIVLPDHGKGFVLRGTMIDETLGGYAFKRQAAVEDGVFRLHTSVRSLVSEIPYAEAKTSAEPMAAMAKTSLRLRPPDSTAASTVDLKTMMAQEPADAAGYAKRGTALYEAQRYREAISDFDKSLALDPKQAWVMGNRALAHFWVGETKAALADADQAELLDPRQPATYRTRGLVAEAAGDWQEGVNNFTRSIDLAPNSFGYFYRARAYLALKDYVRALRDLDAELALTPDRQRIHLNKASAYFQLKQLDKARAELDLVKGPAATDDDLRASRWAVMVQIGDRAAARAESDALLAAHPSATAYLQHIRVRDPTDLVGGESDAGAAYALDPNNLMAMRYLSAYRLRAKDYRAVEQWAERLLAVEPKDLDIRMDRAEARLGQGRLDEARADFAAVREAARSKSNASLLNSICYRQATRNFDLTQAMADCDASLALNRSAATLDSRAFIFLRLGRNQEAVAVFTQALELSPTQADSLYGRSLAERRLGDAAGADKDKAAALAIGSLVAQTYADYGLPD